MNKVIAHLRLMRPANIVTAVADIMAGFAVGVHSVGQLAPELFRGRPVSDTAVHVLQANDAYILTPHLSALLWLMLATAGLYGGGVVLNDVFDAELDKVERPERPIPSGQATVASAGMLGVGLLAAGIVAAWQVSVVSGLIALLIAGLAVLYDAWGKHQRLFGPVNMGLCRGGNLLLGVSALPTALPEVWWVAFIPVVYIAAITMISRGEVHGSHRRILQGGVYLYVFVLAAILALSLRVADFWWQAALFLVLFAYLIFPPLINALRKQEPHLIGKAVKAGVLSLIVMDASLATAFAGWQYGLLVLLLLPVSLWIARKFAVT